jgi:hypothetical protein
MKRIVRLTESDLSRIVKRVIKEEASQTIKARVFNEKDDLKNNFPRACNFDITEVRLDGNGVEFYYTIPGNTKCKVNGVTLIEGYGLAKCGDSTNQIKMEGTQGYLSTVAFKELTKACEAYASTGNKEDSNYA